MKKYSIQLALPEHIKLLPEIEYISASRFPLDTLPFPIRNRVISLEEHAHAQAAGQLWVALVKQTIVGFALVNIVNNMVYLAEIDVYPNYGCKGIGTALIRTIIDWAKTKNLHSIGLTTFTHIPWNAPFYERMGFKRLFTNELPVYLAQVLNKEATEGLKNRTAMLLTL